VLVGDAQEGIDPLEEPLRVLLPEQIVEVHAHGVHAELLVCPAKLAVDGLRVEGVGLEHLKLVDGVGGGVVRPHQPFLFRIPAFSLRRRPASGFGRMRHRRNGEQSRQQEGRPLSHEMHLLRS